MEESVTYQAIIAKGFSLGLTKGHLETAKQLLIKVGTKRFGAPPLSVLKAINAIVDYDKLERLNESLVEISGWDQLPTN